MSTIDRRRILVKTGSQPDSPAAEVKTVVAKELTQAAAHILCKRIRASLDSAGTDLLALQEGKGWKALGYTSWRECATAEFGKSESYLYRQLEAAKTAREISPIGEKIRQLSEGTIRPLTGLAQQDKITVVEAVLAKNDGKVTAAAIQAVVAERHPAKAKSKPKALPSPIVATSVPAPAIPDLEGNWRDRLKRAITDRTGLTLSPEETVDLFELVDELISRGE